jgi:hypothetical protein
MFLYILNIQFVQEVPGPRIYADGDFPSERQCVYMEAMSIYTCLESASGQAESTLS